MRQFFLAALFVASGAVAALADPAYTPVNAEGRIEVILKDHKFTPSEIHIPANKKMELLVKNQDTTADEFLSLIHI